MKINTILSILAAFLIVMSSAYATLTINQPVTFNTTDDGKITFVNTDNTTLIATLNSELVLDSDNKLNVTFSQSQVTINPNTNAPNGTVSTTLGLSTTSTNDLQSGIYTGTLIVKNQSNGAVLGTTSASVIIPALKIKAVTVTPSTFKKGETVTVTVDYENIADKTDLEDINIEVTIYEGDDSKLSKMVRNIDDDELQSDSDVSDLGNGKSASESFEFVMPFDVGDKDTYTVLAKATGRNDEITSQAFESTKTKEFKSKVLDSEVRFTKTQVPTSLACGVKTAKFSIEVQNIGDQSEEVELFVRNSATGFEKILNGGENIELDDKYDTLEDFTQELSETVTLTDLKEGANTYSIVAYYNDGKNTATEDVVINSLCQTTITDSTTSTNTPSDVVVTGTTQTTSNIPTQTIPNLPTASSTPYVALKDVSGPSINTDWLVPAVIGVGGLIIGLAVALLLVPRR